MSVKSNKMKIILTEQQIKNVIDNDITLHNIKGGFLTNKESDALQKEIESNYNDDVKFGLENNDIRTSLYNYDNPLAEKDLNGVNLRIASGLIENDPESGKRIKTYLLYADGKIIGKFYSVDDIKKSIKYIEDRLIKSIE